MNPVQSNSLGFQTNLDMYEVEKCKPVKEGQKTTLDKIKLITKCTAIVFASLATIAMTLVLFKASVTFALALASNSNRFGLTPGNHDSWPGILAMTLGYKATPLLYASAALSVISLISAGVNYLANKQTDLDNPKVYAIIKDELNGKSAEEILAISKRYKISIKDLTSYALIDNDNSIQLNRKV